MRELFKNDLIEVFSKLYKTEEIENEVYFIVNPFDAYIFSSITGAGYLNNESFPFSPKGFMKIANNVYNPKLINGIYNTRFNLENSSRLIYAKFPFIFEDYKKIVFCEINNFEEYKNFVIDVRSNNNDPENIIVYPIDISKNGNGLEPILEFISTLIFNDLGYITEHQTPLSQKLGSPDFLAFQFNSTQLFLQSNDYIKGFHILESSFLFHKSFDKKLTNLKKFDSSLPKRVVGEAKVVSTNIEERLKKYTSSNFFDSSIKLLPEYGLNNEEDCYVSLDNNKLNINLLKNHRPSQPSYLQYENWLKNYLKLFLISNFSSENFKEFVNENNLDESNFYNLNSITIEEILNII